MIFPRTISGQRADWKLLAIILLSCCLLPGSLGAQAPPPPSPPAEAERTPKLPSEKLNQLLGPIALYPDALVALILPASTVPSDVVLAARYIASNGDPAQAANQPWDDSVRSAAGAQLSGDLFRCATGEEHRNNLLIETFKALLSFRDQ